MRNLSMNQPGEALIASPTRPSIGNEQCPGASPQQEHVNESAEVVVFQSYDDGCQISNTGARDRATLSNVLGASPAEEFLLAVSPHTNQIIRESL